MIISSSSSFMPMDTTTIIQNFRPVVGTHSVVYRCAQPDGLTNYSHPPSTTTTSNTTTTTTTTSHAPSYVEHLMLHEVGLIIDLRSDSERRSKQSDEWLQTAPGGAFRVVHSVQDLAKAIMAKDETVETTAETRFPRTKNQRKRRRHVLRLDPLQSDRFMSYLERNWMTRNERLRAAWYGVWDGDALHRLRLSVLNRRGLMGLNEAILETAGACPVQALQAIVIHLEHSNNSDLTLLSPVIIHCVQGKDRTGLLALLIQSIVGVDDDTIVDDYHLSEAYLSLPNTADSVLQGRPRALLYHQASSSLGKLNRQFFAGAPRHVMRATLEWIRSRYDPFPPIPSFTAPTINNHNNNNNQHPGGIFIYLDRHGFDTTWRTRLVTVLIPAENKTRTSSSCASSSCASSSTTMEQQQEYAMSKL